jgi:predicted O-methyltransferase YrrM
VRRALRSLVPLSIRARWRDRRHSCRADPSFVKAWPSIDAVDGWLSKREAELLFTIASQVPEGQSIVEIGSYKGRSTCALAAGAHDSVPIYAVDPHTGDRSQVEAGATIDTWDEFRRNLSHAPHVIPMRALSTSAASSYSGPPIGLIFVDGWHSPEAVIADITTWSAHFAHDVVVFDDFQSELVAPGIAKVAGLIPPQAGAVGKAVVYAESLPASALRLLFD